MEESQKTFWDVTLLDWKIEPDDTEITSLKDIKYEQKTLLLPVIPKMNISARM